MKRSLLYLFRLLGYLIGYFKRSRRRPDAGADSTLTPKPPFAWELFERIAHTRGARPLGNPHQSLELRHFPARAPREHRRVLQLTEGELRNALDSMPPDGGVVQLPEGRLTLGAPLAVASGVTLNGVPGKTELVFIDTDYAITFEGTPESPIQQAGLSNLRILHQGMHKFCGAVFATHSLNLHFSQVEISSPRGIGFLLSDDVAGTSFSRCSVDHAALVGYMFIRDIRETRLEACRAEYCRQSGVFLTDLKLPPGVDAKDFDGQIRYTNQVIGNFAPFAADDPTPIRTAFVNCVFQHNRKMGITTDGVGHLQVIGTVLANNECEGITIDNGSWNCQILNCHIFNNGRRGFQDEHELSIDFVRELGLMEDGTSKAKLPGVSIDNAAYIRVENNHIESNWGDGVKLVRAGYRCTVAGNLIENNNRGANDRFHFFGILVGVAERQHPDQQDFPSSNNNLNSNEILGPHYAGIHLMAGTTGNRVHNNHIEGAAFMAIENHTLTGNQIVES